MRTRSLWQVGVMLLAVLALIGCATGVKGPSDEELVKSLLTAWKGAILEKNADKMMAAFAEDFSHHGYEYEAADKAALRKFVDNCEQQGYFSGVEISFDGASTLIKGDTATVSGIQFKNDQGTVTVELKAKKGKAGWLIADMNIEGL